MKVIRLPRLRRRKQDPPESTSAAPLDQSEQRAHPSLDELLVPYSVYVSRWGADTGDGGRRDADLLEEPSAQNRARPGADTVAFTMAVHSPREEVALGGSTYEASVMRDGDDAVSAPHPGEHTDGVGRERHAGDPVRVLAPDAPHQREHEHVHILQVSNADDTPSNLAPVKADLPERDVPHAVLHGLAEAVRLATLDDAALLAEAGRRRIEGRRAMSREELTAALLAISESDADLAA
jgi:hypothetical protein